MTDPEFSLFLEELFLTYPGLSEWLGKNSPDPKRTTAIWRDQLRNYEMSECVLVLDRWRAAAKPPFAAYERDQVMHLIRASIEFQRDKDAKRNFTDSSANEYKKVRREDYRPLAADAPGLGELLREGQALGLELREGKITQAEYEVRKKSILDRVK